MDANSLFLLRICLAIGAAVSLFIATGLYKVKPGHFAIVSSFFRYRQTIGEGYHYRFPIIFRLSRQYPKGDIAVRVKVGKNLYLEAKACIIDPKAFYYGRKSIGRIMADAYGRGPSPKDAKAEIEKALVARGVALSEIAVTER